MRKKIVLLGPTYPYRGGNSLFMSYLYQSLCDDFEVCFLNFSLMYPRLLFPGTTQYDESDTHFSKVPSKRIINSINPLSWKKVARAIEKERPDLIAFDWWQPFFGPCYRGISGALSADQKKKVIFITENLISHEARWIDKTLTLWGLKHAKQFLALSQIVADDLKEIAGGRPIYRSELPVFGWFEKEDESQTLEFRQSLGFHKEHKVLLFFGYVRKYKGLDILMEAFARLYQKDNSYRLLIAGEFYDSPKQYLDILRKHQIESAVKLVNQYIPNEKVALYFQASDVVVMPYRSATQSGIMNIAYGYSKPMVVTKVGGLAEFLEDGFTGVMVDKPVPEDVVKGVERFYKLKESVDFAANIQARNQKNSFTAINQIFYKMLEYPG